MQPQLTNDQELFADTTRRFLQEHADVEAVRGLRRDERGYDVGYWRRGAELGWTSLAVGEEHGGGSISDNPLADLTIVAYEFGRHAAPGPLIATNVVAAALGRSGTAAQRESVLPSLLSGEGVASWAIAEPRPHDRLGGIAMEATPDGTGWSLTGTKLQVEAGGSADHILVTTTSPTGPAQFLVATDTPGLTLTAMQSIDLTRRFAEVVFDNVAVPASAVVGEVGHAAADVAQQLRIANVLQCAEMVGAMDAAMDITLEWVMDRYSFGRPLGGYQAIKHRLADMKTWLEASHGIADGAAHAVHNDERADEMCSAAKAYIGAQGPELCQECVQFHGGIGVTYEHDMHLFLRRVIVNATTHGTVTDHRLRLTDILETQSVGRRAGGEAA
ncbi:MAG: acyl-CoA/acyl-ACP dehydrogenase [Acidimicrobiales bacterium]|nr:acyl-CoA/acyl-ACP dehydrogenase [Acidimicrobiales bacterium]